MYSNYLSYHAHNERNFFVSFAEAKYAMLTEKAKFDSKASNERPFPAFLRLFRS